LGLKRATDARAAFLRALRAAPEDERKLIARRESERLDQLEVRIRTRDAATPDKMERRLAALAVLRQGLD
jgi:aminoglycoside phosphotransferase (APT) family kinase protein